jgi:pyruvate/2-oxoglutarate dehydrogenase complex dihydrolipoamide dehydrogenase (E3) component
MSDYHLIAIGAGTGGLTVTKLVARRGKRVAMIERARPGGDCLWTGCVPTKSLVHAAKVFYQAKHGERLGIIANDLGLDFAAVRKHVLASQREAGQVESDEAIAANGVDLIRGEARFIDAHTLDIDGRRVTADYFVIATGAEPVAPPIPGLLEAGFDTNVQAVEWESLPKSLVVIGGGPIGCEFGQMMNRFGVETTILQSADRLLERDDIQAALVIRAIMEREGIAVHSGAMISSVERTRGGRLVRFTVGDREQSVVAERILVAAGRKPEIDALNLDAAGVQHNARGIVVDGGMRSSRSHIFAVGDIAGGYQFTHVAEAQARLVANLINKPGRIQKRFQTWSNRVVPRVTYTDPEVASVGLTEKQANERYRGKERVWHLPLAAVDRAITMGQTEGFFKVITAPGWQRRIPGLSGALGDEIAGACLVGPNAGECLMPLVVAMKARLPIGLVAWSMQAYPTLALGVRQVTGMPFDK